jgi:pyruvate ferredoxin oxidoreductase alpha subunit
MSMRDAGWIQLYAESNQEAADIHIQAFRLAEELSMPVMVCMDGFILTHAYEQVDMPAQEQVDAFLPPYEPRQVLDPADPVTIGAMVGPEAFTEVKYLEARRQLRALDVVQEVADRFRDVVGRASGGLIAPYRVEDADVVLVGLGSLLGTAADVVDELRDEGLAVGALGVTCFRPWPTDEIRAALGGASRVVVLNRAISVGAGSVLGAEVRLSVAGTPVIVHDVVAGLGGRPVTRDLVRRLLTDAVAGELSDHELIFADLDAGLAARELEAELEHEETSR